MNANQLLKFCCPNWHRCPRAPRPCQSTEVLAVSKLNSIAAVRSYQTKQRLGYLETTSEHFSLEDIRTARASDHTKGILKTLWGYFFFSFFLCISWMLSTVLKAFVDSCTFDIVHLKNVALCCDATCTLSWYGGKIRAGISHSPGKLNGRKTALIKLLKCMFTLRTLPYFFQLDIKY